MDADPRLKDEVVMAVFHQYLSPRQKRPEIYKFILSFVVCRNVAQAGKESGLENAAYWRGKPEIHKCIEEITAMAVIKHGYDANDVIERAKEIAAVDPIELQNPDGTFKANLNEVAPEVRRAIKKFKAKNIYGEDANGMRVVVGQLIEVEFWNKLQGIELLGSEKNIFKKTSVVQHDVTSNMKDVLLESGSRAEERLRALEAREVGDGSGQKQISGGEAGGGDSEWSRDGVLVGERGGS